MVLFTVGNSRIRRSFSVSIIGRESDARQTFSKERDVHMFRSKIKVGNFYANRSITGAKVESQPFGGENKSGTGFKAGGPNYLLRFMTERTTTINTTAFGGNIELLNS